MIDSEWFYRELEKSGRSLRDMARSLGLHPSAVSRMLKGERKMSAEEQDAIAQYLGVSISDVAMRRRGDQTGFAEQAQEPIRMDAEKEKRTTIVKNSAHGEGKAGDGDDFFERIRSKMAGTVTIPPGVDITEPADPEWGRVYDDDHEYPLHL
jgi:transcriptional regulator with XRE-family HTH domain